MDHSCVVYKVDNPVQSSLLMLRLQKVNSVSFIFFLFFIFLFDLYFIISIFNSGVRIRSDWSHQSHLMVWSQH